jgi:ribulose kinase
MKSSLLVAVIAACALSTAAVSAQEKSAPAMPAMNMAMDQQMPQTQEKIEKLQQQMEVIRAMSDPQEQKKLKQEHVQAMHQYTRTMHAWASR